MVVQLRQLIDANPFVPFTMHMANGRKHRIPTMDHIAVAPTGTRIAVFPDDTEGTVLLAARLISELTIDPEQASA